MSNLNTCPGCGGVADNGHDRCIPPSPYYCTKCEEKENKDSDNCFREQCYKNKEKRLDVFNTTVEESNITKKIKDDVTINTCGNTPVDKIRISKDICCSSLKIKMVSNLIYMDKKRRWAVRNKYDDLSSRIYYCPFCGDKLK